MNFLPVLSPWQWALFGAVPLGILLLYFLKLRRQPLAVPSTFLWQRTVEDSRANSLLQRLRRNLLLFLQLLFLVLATLALLRPGWQGDRGEGRRLIFLLDASASMAATDLAGAASRFEHAKGLIADQIDAMRADDVAMLMAFSDRPAILQEFTSDRRQLRRTLDIARVTHRPTDIREALRGAVGLASPNQTGQTSQETNPRRTSGGDQSSGGDQASGVDPTGAPDAAGASDAVSAELWIYSDGGFGPVDETNLGDLPTTYVSIGSRAASNLAIVAFSAERNVENPNQVQAFARVVNFGERALQATASLTVEGALVDAAAVDVEGGGESGLSFELDSLDATELKLSLEVDDDLAVDDVAYAALTPLRNLSALLVTPGNRALELALATEQAEELGEVEVKPPSYLETDGFRTRAMLGRDDLIIFDRCAPAEMPAANTFFIGSVPPVGWEAGELTGPPLPIDIDRTHPIMRFLELFSLKIVEGHSLEAPRHGVPLITADIGPVLVLAPRAGFQDLVMGFDVISQTDGEGAAFNTDWPVHRSWPVFIYNVMRYLGGAVDATGAPSYSPGEPVTLRIDHQLREVQLTSPGDQSQTIRLGAAGQFVFAETDPFGIYRISATEGQRPLSVFTVNLFDHRESSLQPADSIDVGSGAIAGSEAQLSGRSELWRWLLMAALGMLAVEWLVFNRRLA